MNVSQTSDAEVLRRARFLLNKYLINPPGNLPGWDPEAVRLASALVSLAAARAEKSEEYDQDQ